MPSRLLLRRSAAAVGLYAGVALGVLGTVVAARRLGLETFGLFATVTAIASFFQVMLDLTVEESLTKYGFRYITAGDWGRLRRLFSATLRIKTLGGAAAAVALLAAAPVADSLFDAGGLGWPLVAIAALPLIQAPENVSGTALLLRGRYDLRGFLGTLSMALRLVGIVVGSSFGLTETIVGMVAGQALATAIAIGVGRLALSRFPDGAPVRLGADRREIVGFVVRSSAATGVVSLRTALAPLLLGVVAGPTSVGLLRVAQAPQSGLAAASSPVRLILLTEQTRDWELGERQSVMRGVARFSRAALVAMALAVPAFFFAMPWLVETVFGSDYAGAVTAARIVLFAAAVQLVFGWTKSFPTSIGRPGLRVVTHGIEAVVLLPLVVLFGVWWGVSGAAAAILVSSAAFGLVWLLLLARIRRDVGPDGRRDPRGVLAG